jgi:hypothetical protein
MDNEEIRCWRPPFAEGFIVPAIVFGAFVVAYLVGAIQGAFEGSFQPIVWTAVAAGVFLYLILVWRRVNICATSTEVVFGRALRPQIRVFRGELLGFRADGDKMLLLDRSGHKVLRITLGFWAMSQLKEVAEHLAIPLVGDESSGRRWLGRLRRR